MVLRVSFLLWGVVCSINTTGGKTATEARTWPRFRPRPA
ncbi:hypothetical protein ATPR_3377 [Acetobacter tropicalis NBRC 101654]|uniref:Uncharacterized protein n=1 Tax=Acetobacter tropicalis NBRC 101654 TaxID=749388 RepID=F7VJ28_9PROT|nr:hypothetical protein ATPR_3377 [Acetobacter tropicalis NBRC 101654]